MHSNLVTSHHTFDLQLDAYMFSLSTPLILGSNSVGFNGPSVAGLVLSLLGVITPMLLLYAVKQIMTRPQNMAKG